MDGSPGWQVMGHQSPRTPAAQHVENAVDNFASRVFDMDRLFRYGRDQRLQDLPLRVCQIRGIGFPVVHLFFSIPVLFTYASPFLYRLDDARLTLSKSFPCCLIWLICPARSPVSTAPTDGAAYK